MIIYNSLSTFHFLPSTYSMPHTHDTTHTIWQLPKWRTETTLGEIADINPTESLSKGKNSKYVPMDCIDSFTRKIARFERKEFQWGMKFRNGDTLLARITPCLENGKTAYVDILDNDEVGFGSTEYIVIREKSGFSDKKFLYYLSISPRFRDIAIKAMNGTSWRQRVQTDVLENKILILPPLPEQRAIATVLSSFDDKIELLREENKTLEATAQTIFKEWFGKYNIDDELPEGWRVGKISDFWNIVCGKTPSKDNSDFFWGDIPFIKIPDMHNDVFIIKTEDSLTEEWANSQKNKFIPRWSICVSCIATVGLVSIASQDSQTNQQINSIVPNKDFYLEYLYFVLTNMKDYLIGVGSWGSATLNINTSVFSNIKIVSPAEKKIQEYHSHTSPIFEKIITNSKQIQSLSKARDTLLPKLMKGEVRVEF